jgi:hypothetical protein
MRFSLRYASAAFTLMAVVACASDRVASPAATEPGILSAKAPSVVAANAEAATVVSSGELPVGVFANVLPSNVTTYTFWVDGDQSKTVLLGTHMVTFPAYTICDPATSNYGPSYWLWSCSKLTYPIQITATTWTSSDGRPQVDFDKHIRFYKNYANELPAIYLRDPAASLTSWGRVDYCSTTCVNEAASDPVLQTKRDPATGYLYRLIRHFSGYIVWE